MELKIDQLTFEAAHWIQGHEGKCAFIHGHTYIIKNLMLEPHSQELNGMGMIVDFGHVKKFINDTYDHKLFIPGGPEHAQADVIKRTLEGLGMGDNIIVVRYGTVEYLAIHIQTALRAMFNLKSVKFEITEGLNQGVVV